MYIGFFFFLPLMKLFEYKKVFKFYDFLIYEQIYLKKKSKF